MPQISQSIVHGYAMLLGRKCAVIDLRKQWAENNLVWRHLACQRHNHHGASVEPAGEGDDRAATRLSTSHLDRVLHCLCPSNKKRGLFRLTTLDTSIDFLSELNIGTRTNAESEKPG